MICRNLLLQNQVMTNLGASRLDGGEFAPLGKAGGGLACSRGGVRLPRGLLHGQADFTFTAWINASPPQTSNGWSRVYSEYLSRNPNDGNLIGAIAFPADGKIRVNAWNGDWVPHADTPSRVLPFNSWAFVAVRLSNGGVRKGTLDIFVDEKQYSRQSQLIRQRAVTAFVGDRLHAVNGLLDEVSVYQRPLSDEEIQVLREIGRSGRTLRAPKVGTREAALEDDPADLKPFAKAEENSLVVNSIGMELRLIPAGEFMMGSSRSAAELARIFDWKAQDFENEYPQHRVRISRDFYLGTTEVTQGQWQALMGTTPWSGAASVKVGADCPAAYVIWDDAVEFCRRLSAKEAVTYRLPTEAEWEYACRAGSRSMYSYGDDPSQLGEFAWVFDNASRSTQRLGTRRPNAWGLFDMHGNAWEWCSDWYDKNYYADSPLTDPGGSASGSHRVVRGGRWDFSPRSCRSASRFYYSPGHMRDGLGFRVAAVPSASTER